MDYNVQPIPAFKDNYIWAIIHAKKKCALIVDPGDADPVLHYLQQHQLTLSGILITHDHWDHTNGLAGIIKQYAVPIFGPKNSRIAELTHFLNAQDSVSIDFFPTYQVIEIPGHTLDHVAYYSHGQLFCGDTLFAAGCGRLFEGTASQLYASLQKLLALPDNTNIYCGHEYTLNNLYFAETVDPSNSKIKQRIEQTLKLREKNFPSLPVTLKEEKETNPFLRCDCRVIIDAVERYAGVVLPTCVDVFSELRKWKDQF